VAATAEPLDIELEQRAALALAKHPDLAWTDSQIARLTDLLAQADADADHWAACDLVLALEPMQPTSGARRNGVHARLRDLAQRAGTSYGRLRAMRTTGAAWPPGTRPANYHVAKIYTVGGAAAAHERLAVLEHVPRGPSGRLTVEAFVRYRNEHLEPARSGSRRTFAVKVSPVLLFALAVNREVQRRSMPTPDAAEIADEIYRVVERVDRWARARDPEHRKTICARLDAVVAAVALIADCLPCGARNAR
jgi:hypothetical protein